VQDAKSVRFISHDRQYSVLQRIPAPALLWFSILVFGAASSIVRILTDLGAQNPIDGRNAISFCNLFFAGNACALVVLYGVHHKTWTADVLRRITAREWCSLFVLAILASGVAPWLFFLAIENTMVTSVVLVSQVEPPLFLLLSWIVFRDRFGPWSIIGAAVCLAGVALSVLLQPTTNDVMIGRGELFAAMAAVTYAISTVIARRWLKQVPVGIFSVFRSAVGTVVFFIIAYILFGPTHFIDIGSPFLWQWMIVYGGIIVVSGQLAWDSGMRRSRAIDVSMATSFAPVAGIFAAFILLGEQPLRAHYIGGAVLVVGIVMCLLGARKKGMNEVTVSATESGDPAMDQAPPVLAAECRTGFKGI
jgi:drug/metabolite transporter (DMT)-like permease